MSVFISTDALRHHHHPWPPLTLLALRLSSVVVVALCLSVVCVCVLLCSPFPYFAVEYEMGTMWEILCSRRAGRIARSKIEAPQTGRTGAQNDVNERSQADAQTSGRKMAVSEQLSELGEQISAVVLVMMMVAVVVCVAAAAARQRKKTAALSELTNERMSECVPRKTAKLRPRSPRAVERAAHARALRAPPSLASERGSAI